MAIEDRALKLVEFIENNMPSSPDKPPEPRMRARLLKDGLRKKREGFERIPAWPALASATSRKVASELAGYMTLGMDTNALEDVKNDNLSMNGAEDVRIFHIPNWNRGTTAEVTPQKAKHLNAKHRMMVVNAKGGVSEKAAIDIAMERDLLTRIDELAYLPKEPSGALLYVKDNKPIGDDESIFESGVKHVFNIYKGVGIKAEMHLDAARRDELDLALNVVLGALTRDKPKQMHYVKAWIASAILTPWKKSPTVWASLGGGGIGKTTIGGMLLPALVGKHNSGFFDAEMLNRQFSIEPFVNKTYAYGDELEIKGNAAKANFKRIIKSITIGGEMKYVGARNYDILCSIMVSMNNDRFDLRTSRTSDMSEERSVYMTVGWDEESTGLSKNEFREWRDKNIRPATDAIRKVVESNDKTSIAHYLYRFEQYEFEPRLLEDISTSSHTEADQAEKMLSAPVRVFIRLLKNNNFGGGIKWGPRAFSAETLKEALRDVAKMDVTFDVSVAAVIGVMKRIDVISEKGRALIPTKKRGTVVGLLEKTYNIEIKEECEIEEAEYGDINISTVETNIAQSNKF